jgi:hypothetical protein
VGWFQNQTIQPPQPKTCRIIELEINAKKLSNGSTCVGKVISQ